MPDLSALDDMVSSLPDPAELVPDPADLAKLLGPTDACPMCGRPPHDATPTPVPAPRRRRKGAP